MLPTSTLYFFRYRIQKWSIVSF